MDLAIKRLIISMFFPGLLLIAIWLVFIFDSALDLDLVFSGLYPRKWSGLRGVLFSPLIHGGIKHIGANSFPLFVLATLLFYFYRQVAFRVLLISWLVTGILVWIMARPAYHVGASGLIYSFGGFLFLSGIIRKHLGLIAISFLVVFQYGSMIWGIFPIEDKVSWEGHLMGLMVGLVLSWIYRKRGPAGSRLFWQRWDEQEQGDNEDDVSESLPWDEYEVEGKRKPILPVAEEESSINNEQ